MREGLLEHIAAPASSLPLTLHPLKHEGDHIAEGPLTAPCSTRRVQPIAPSPEAA